MTSSTGTTATALADITRTVTEVVADILGRPVDALSPDTDLRGVEGADSIKVVRIIAKIEQTFDIELEDDEIFGISTIAEVVALVEKATARERRA